MGGMTDIARRVELVRERSGKEVVAYTRIADQMNQAQQDRLNSLTVESVVEERRRYKGLIDRAHGDVSAVRIQPIWRALMLSCSSPQFSCSAALWVY